MAKAKKKEEGEETPKKKKSKAMGAGNLLAIIDDCQSMGLDTNIFNGEDAALQDDRIVLHSPKLNYIYGLFKMNAIHRFNGKESGGKTTLCIYLMAECQRARFEKYGNWEHSHVIIWDFERTFDVMRAKQIGLRLYDPTNPKIPLVHVIRTFFIEDACAMWERMVRSGQLCATLLDSDAAAPNKTENSADSEIGKATFGASAKACGIVIKRINPLVDTYQTPFLWISQERANQAMMAHLPKITGGEAPNFYASTRVRVTPGDPNEYPTRDGEIIGIVIKIKVYKNKTARPFRETKITVYFDGGIDEDEQYGEMLETMEVIKVGGGGWRTWTDPLTGEPCKCQGTDQLKAWFNEHPDSYKALKKEVDDSFVNFNKKLDSTAIEISEEAQFQEEKKELLKRLKEGTASAVEKAAAEAGYITDEEYNRLYQENEDKTATTEAYINQKVAELDAQEAASEDEEEGATDEE